MTLTEERWKAACSQALRGYKHETSTEGEGADRLFCATISLPDGRRVRLAAAECQLAALNNQIALEDNVRAAFNHMRRRLALNTAKNGDLN